MELGRKDRIQLGPVVGGTADRRRVDLPQQAGHGVGLYPVEGIVGTREFGVTFDCHPLPSRPKYQCGSRPHPQVRELLSMSTCHEGDDLFTRYRMAQYPGVDDRRLG